MSNLKIYFKGKDGREYGTLREVIDADKRYCESIRIEIFRIKEMISNIGKDGLDYYEAEDIVLLNRRPKR